MKVIFYSTHCPKCAVLQSKLNEKSIEYIENNNIEDMIKTGYRTAPLLEVDGEVMDFTSAIKWVNER